MTNTESHPCKCKVCEEARTTFAQAQVDTTWKAAIRIAKAQQRREHHSAMVAASAGRELVQHCRIAGSETAEQIAKALDARRRG